MTNSSVIITSQERTFGIFRDEEFKTTLENLIEKIEVSAPGEDHAWFEALTAYTSDLADMGQKTAMAEAAILSTVKRLWANETINPEITSRWEGSFWHWAKNVSQRGVEPPTEVSLQNRISVYDFYFANQNGEDGFALPPTLTYEVESLDENGHAIIEEVTIEQPNLHQAAYGKLLAAKGLAVKNGGNLADVTIAAMINSNVTVKDFKNVLKIEKSTVENAGVLDATTANGPATPSGDEGAVPEPGGGSTASLDDDVTAPETEDENVAPPIFVETDVAPELDLRVLDDADKQGVYYQGGILYYHQDDITVPTFILATADEGATHPLVSVGQNYVLNRFGIHDPELDVSPEPVEAPTFFINEEGEGLLTLNGYQFAYMSLAEVVELQAAINDRVSDWDAHKGPGGPG